MNRSGNYYLLTSLPPLGEPGAAPPLSPSELRTRASSGGAGALVDVVLLSDDLRQRQALLAGELEDATSAVLTADEIAGASPLPGFLRAQETASSPRHPDDLVWEAYWRHAALMARRKRSRFLDAWVRREVALRNGLAAVRARVLGRTPDETRVAEHLSAEGPTVARNIDAWLGAADPLEGWRALLRARWEWAVREEPHFTFGQDEVVGYAVRLLILRDWRRTMGTMGTTGVAA